MTIIAASSIDAALIGAGVAGAIEFLSLLLSLRRRVLGDVNEHIDSRIDTRVGQVLDPLKAEVGALRVTVRNGLTARVKENGDAIQAVAVQVARVAGTVDTLLKRGT